MATAGNIEEAEIRLVFSNGEVVGKNMKELQKQGNKLRAVVKGLNEDTEEFAAANKELGEVEREYKRIKDRAEELKKAQTSLNDTMAQYIPFYGKIQQFVKGYKDLKTAKDAATLSTKLFGKALIGTGIGAIVVLLGSLYTWLTTTTKGTNLLRIAWEPVVQMFQRLIGIGQEVGEVFFEKLVGWVKDPIGAIKDFGKALLDNIINRFTAIAKFGPAIQKIFSKDWKQGLMDLGDAVVQAGTGIEDGMSKAVDGVKSFGAEMANAAKDGLQIAKLTEQIAESQIEATKRTGELSTEYKRLSEIAEDISKSAPERVKAADMAKKVAEEEYSINKRVLDLKIEKMELEQKANDTSYEGQQELADLIRERNDLETAMIEKRTTANSKFNAANQKIQANELARIKAIEAEEKRVRAEKAKSEEELNKKLLAAAKTLQDERIALMDDETDQRIAKLLLSYERELEAFEGSEEQKAEFAKLKKQQLDRDLQAIDDETVAKRKEKALKDLDEQAQLEQAKVEELFYNKLISEEEKNEQLYQLQVDALESRLALMVAAGETESLQYQNIYTQLAKLHSDHEEKKTQETEKNEAKREEIRQKGLQAAANIFAGFADLLSGDEEARKKNWKTIKALKRAEILSNLPTEISNIWKNANLLPVPFNGIVGAAQTALAMGRSIKQMADLNKVKYQYGGPVFGRSHALGGIPFSVRGAGGYEMEGNEIILTKGVYQNPLLRSAASMINVAGGGRAFADGGVVPMASTPVAGSMPGTVINNITNQSSGPQQSDQSLINEVKALRQDLNEWQTEFEVKLSLSKLSNEQKRMKEIDLETSF